MRARGKPHRAGRQEHPALRQALGEGRARAERQVQRSRALMRGGYGASGRTPGAPQPRGRVQPRAIEFLQHGGAGHHHPAQHRVHQPGERRQAPGAGQCHRRRDRGVRRRLQQQHASRAQPQHMTHGVRRLLVQIGFKSRVQRSHPAQDCRGEPVRRGSIAPRKVGRQRVQRLLERAAAVQHGAQQIEGGFSGRVGHGVMGLVPPRGPGNRR